MEGPRALQPGELDALRALTDTVFRPEMIEQYPQLFDESNWENLQVCFEEGRCASHVGMTQQDASLFGCRIRVACIGAVSTHPDYRQRGLASACFDGAVAKAYRDGVDVMLVSGSRSLYMLRGCLRVGRDTSFAVTPEWKGPQTPAVTIEAVTDETEPWMRACYRAEPVRFLRTPQTYRFARSGMVMNRFSHFLILRERGDFRGYVILQQPHDLALRPLPEPRTMLAEFAGDRRALLAALPELVRRYALTELRFQVQRHDALFASLCTQAGLAGSPSGASGTLKLINFPQLMARMQPWFAEVLGTRDAAQLAFWQEGDRYGFGWGDEQLLTDRDTATRLAFGTLEGAEREALAGHDRLAGRLAQILPLPCLWYGMNYV